jgi:hypothetical protein
MVVIMGEVSGRAVRFCLVERTAAVLCELGSCWGRAESGDSEQIVGGSHQMRIQLGAAEAAVASFAQAAHGLHPAEEQRREVRQRPIGEFLISIVRCRRSSSRIRRFLHQSDRSQVGM